jgi:Na+/H+ antiporter 1
MSAAILTRHLATTTPNPELLAVRRRPWIAVAGRASSGRPSSSARARPNRSTSCRTVHAISGSSIPGGERLDTLDRFEHWWATPVQFVLLFFGLANAGVPFEQVGLGTYYVLAALLLGKPIGILALSWGARALGADVPPGVGMRQLSIVGVVAWSRNDHGDGGPTIQLPAAAICCTLRLRSFHQYLRRGRHNESRDQDRSCLAPAAYFTTRTRSTVTSAPPVTISSRIGRSLSTCA